MTPKTYNVDDVKAVILVGAPDFGRCPLATRMNRALWPIAGRPVLQQLVEHISSQGVRRFVICYYQDDCGIEESLDFPKHLNVEYRVENLPRGTAGCIRDAADPKQDQLLFVFPAATTAPPDLHELISAHREKAGLMTIFFAPMAGGLQQDIRDAQIYVCEPEIVKYIPAQGFFDSKENLVPTLVQAGQVVAYAQLTKPVGTFRHWTEYIQAVKEYLVNLPEGDLLHRGFKQYDSQQRVWIGQNVTIDPSAKIIGPALIGDNVTIEANALLFGPFMLESGVQIHEQALVSESVIWEHAVIGRQSQIQDALVDRITRLSSCANVNKQVVVRSSGPVSLFSDWMRQVFARTGDRSTGHGSAFEDTLLRRFSKPGGEAAGLLLFLAVFCCLLTAYWNPTLIELWQTWMQSDEYSSGILVPLLAAYVLWDRRKALLQCPIKPVPAAVLFLLGVQILRLIGLLIWSPSLERLSLFLTAGVLIWMVLGWRALKAIFPVWLYLILMFPLPKMIEWRITIPLQKWASVSAVFCLETLGFQIIREGNIININGTLVAVAEACNGLRMLTAFFVVTGFVVLLSRRKLWEKIIILISSVPIALLCNTLRLTVTSIAFMYLDAEEWEKAFHDYGGLAMMPLALGITLVELWFLSKVVIDPDVQLAKTDVIVRKKANP